MWAGILSGSKSESICQRLQSLFPAETWIESQGFSLIHRTVLGLNVLNLDDLLASVPVSMMSSCDVRGRTALWWTALRGDYPAMSSLLQFEIDVYKTTSTGSNALNAAIWSGNQHCVKILLHHIDNFTYYDPTGWSALHQLAYRGSDVENLETMIISGVDINSTTHYADNTALSLAAQENKHLICEHLLSRNADANILNADGETALRQAIANNSHRSIELIIQRTNHQLKTKAGESLFQLAAQYSDQPSLEILYASDIDSICTRDVVTANSESQKPMELKGLNGLEIAEARTDVTPEWLAMFRKLKEKIDSPKPKNHTVHTEPLHGEAEDFHDAVESWDS